MTIINKKYGDSSRYRLLFLIGSAFLIAFVYTLVIAEKIWRGEGFDFIAHAEVAESMLNGGKMPPHFMVQILLIAVNKLFGLAYLQASLIVTFVFVLMTYIVAYKGIQDNKSSANSYFFILAACLLLLSHPIAILFPFDGNIYYGYIASNVFHNPSILLLKFFALLNFILLCKLLENHFECRVIFYRLLVLASLTILSIIAKPSYIIVLLPAMLGLFLLKRVRAEAVGFKWSIVAYGIVVPACCILIWQFIYFYSAGNNNSIGVGFFEVYKINSQVWTVLPKLFASMAFPMAVAFVMGSRFTKQLDFQLSTLMMTVALIFCYFLVDRVGGDGVAAGNFWWSAQIANFILQFVCIRAYVHFLLNSDQMLFTKLMSKNYLPGYVAAGQFIFGIIWVYQNSTPGFLRL